MKIYENWNTDFHLDWQKAAFLIMTILFNQMRNNINRTWEVEIQKYFLELRRWRSYWNRMCLYLRRGRFKVRGGDAGNTVAVWILAVYNKHRLKTLLLISKLLFFVHSYITTYPKGQLTTLQGSLGRHSYLWVFGWTAREPLYLNTARAVSWTTGFESIK